jgi:Hypervirulence associated proteins TUDOR domain
MSDCADQIPDGERITMAEKNFSKGDKVQWKSHGQNVKGTVEEKITSDKKAGGRQVRASKDDPQYRVKSDKTGADAVHKPDALKPDKK